MPRPPKQGIDYAGWSVDIFDGDTKIDKLLDAQGWIGFSIYFYLCQMAYKFDGYFYRWSYDDAPTTARRMGSGVGSKAVKNTVGLCLQIGLFDKPLFDRHGILTSRGIQRRYLAATQGRRVRSIKAEYWLLEKNGESGGLDKCTENSSLQDGNHGLQCRNQCLQCENSIESKVKERKENKSTPPAPPRGDVGVFAGYAGGDESLLAALNDYEQMRKKIKKPMTDRARRMLCKKLDELSDRYNRIDLINEAVLHCWQSVYPPKEGRTDGFYGTSGRDAAAGAGTVKTWNLKTTKL